ncbi:F-box/LRR-repeat protein 2-like isoform X3 [Nasonia vitripennis]|uniref:F-box domain-containing protein n=1 Tax=Nasonia vitripennis TaxID=7425 RepID=A0A7M7Q7A2_NASVI|nr:F-box/LRR-repeat protein 2-like isoform X3 [Nasonia vitripennis]
METRAKSKRARRNEIVGSWNPDVEVAINKLNDDCLTKIFMFLPIVDRVRIEGVCKRWRNISKESWQNFKTLNADLAIWGSDVVFYSPNVRRILEQVLQRSGSFLRHLDLFLFLRMESYILHSIGNLCPNLQYLDIQTIKLTLPAMKILTKNCHNLKALTFGESTMACDDTPLSEFFSENKQLQYLKLVLNYSCTGKCLLSLPADMDTIIMERCSLRSINYLSRALKQFGQLKTFSFMRSVCSALCDPFPTVIHSLPTTLKILEMSNLLFSNIDCIAENCKKLYHLDISGSKNVTETGIQAITSLPEIKHLVLNYLPEITGYNFTYMPKLQTLCCRGCDHLKDDGLCTLLTMCDLIEFMDLYGCVQITNILLKCALNVVKTRTNNLVLHLILSQDGLFDLRPIYANDTLLKITLLTERESRDEDED